MASISGSKAPSSLKILQAYDSDSEESSSSPEIEDDGACRHRPTPKNDRGVCLSEPQTKRPRIDMLARMDKNVPEVKACLTNGKVKNGAGQAALLPLPKNILEMFSSSDSNNEGGQYNDPTLHMGRQRSFPHVRGNWASFLYLPCSYSDDDHLLSKLQSIIDEASSEFEDVHAIHSIEDKHVTLSRTLSFRHHWIEGFISSLRKEVGRCRRIQLVLEEFSVYTNDEKTRTFISMSVATTQSLLALVKICDECLNEYELPPYYRDPSFHISCAWMLGDARNWAEKQLLPFLNDKWHRLVQEDADLQVHSADAVEFKTGNKLYRFPFNKEDH